MQIRAYKDLQELHTFGVPWQCEVFCSLHTAHEAQAAINYAREQEIDVLVLGGGSNILPTANRDGLVIKNEIGGRAIMDVTPDETVLRIGSGENWQDLVMWTLEQEIYGLENLSLIPGTVGGAVVQNIGAYDVDIARFVRLVEVVDIQTGVACSIPAKHCGFEYRTSIFKQSAGRWMITAVILALPQNWEPTLSYASLRSVFGDNTAPTATEVAEAVMAIRRDKLPDWEMVGTAGSFFANPRVDDKTLKSLQKTHPDIPVFHNYDSFEHTIPAGWLVEHCGLLPEEKEKYLYPKHHLVVVNNNKNTEQTTGKDISDFTQKVQARVQDKFGIKLTPEVVIL